MALKAYLIEQIRKDIRRDITLPTPETVIYSLGICFTIIRG